jgi:hypothetical protein
MNYINCTCDCPICQAFKEIPKKKTYLMSVIDKKDGKIKVLSANEQLYKSIIRKTRASAFQQFFVNIWYKICDSFLYLRIWFCNGKQRNTT